jgi:hypothetical protein
MQKEIVAAIQHLAAAASEEASNPKSARAHAVQAANILAALLGTPAVGPDVPVDPPANKSDGEE